MIHDVPAGTEYTDRQLPALDRSRDGRAHPVVAVAFEQQVEFLDAAAGKLRLAVRDLREQLQGLGAEVEQLLALASTRRGSA